MGYDNENDQVDDEARKERERVETDLRRAVFGSDTSKNNSRLSRSPKTEKAILIADEKKKKEEESKTRETLKRAQEALDRHLEELQRQIDAIKRQIAEAKKDILDVEEQLRKKYGDNWEEKFRKGEADKNDRLYQEWSRKHEKIDELEKKYDKLEKQRESIKELRKELGTEGLTPKMRAKIDELVENSDGRLMAAKSIDLLDDTDKKMEAVESLGVSGATKDLARLSFQDENIYESAEEFTLDAPVKSTSFAKSIDGNFGELAGLKESFRLKANGKNLLPEKSFGAETEVGTKATPEQLAIIPKNG